MKKNKIIRSLAENVLSEELLDEAAKQIADLDFEDIALLVEDYGRGICKFILYRPDVLREKYSEGYEAVAEAAIVGYFSMAKDDDCNAWVTKMAGAERGYGPVLYDMAMSRISPESLMADRRDTSESARRVWAYMLTVRANDYNIQPVGQNCKHGNENGDAAMRYSFAIKDPVNYKPLIANHQRCIQNMVNDDGLNEENIAELIQDAGFIFFGLKIGG